MGLVVGCFLFAHLDFYFFCVVCFVCRLLTTDQDMKNNSSLSTRGCGKISDANVPGSIDQAILRTKENPGPSHYRVEDVDFDSVTHQ